jgi:hypothetical protein
VATPPVEAPLLAGCPPEPAPPTAAPEPPVLAVVPALDVDVPAELDAPPVGTFPPIGGPSLAVLHAMIVARMQAPSNAGESSFARVSPRLP